MLVSCSPCNHVQFMQQSNSVNCDLFPGRICNTIILFSRLKNVQILKIISEMIVLLFILSYGLIMSATEYFVRVRQSHAKLRRTQKKFYTL